MTLTTEEEKAWNRSGGRCECTATTHGHSGRCPARLNKNMRGERGKKGSWEIHHKTSKAKGGKDVASNYLVLCTFKPYECHQKTRTFGS